MDLQEFLMLLNAAELGRVLLEKSGEPRLEAFSGNAIYSRRGMPTMNKYKTVKEVCDLTGLTRKHLYYFHHENVVRAVAYANYSVEGYNGFTSTPRPYLKSMICKSLSATMRQSPVPNPSGT